MAARDRQLKAKTVILLGVGMLIIGLLAQVQASSAPWYAKIDGMIASSVGCYQIRQGRKRLREEKAPTGPVADA